MIDFLILYENKNREIESICLLKMQLEKMGYSVKICQVQYFFGEKINAKVVLTPFLYNDEDIYKYIFCICGKIDKIINFRWEQIYSKENENNLDCFFYPKGETRKVIHLCWGEKQASVLQKVGVKKENLPVVGAPHLDMIRLEGYFEEREYISKKYTLSMDKKWILFVSSFSNSTFTEKEKKDALKKMGSDRVMFIDISIESKKIILDWFKVLAQQEKFEIIYRPHPSEKNSEDLGELERENKFFHVITEESVGQWIKCSDYVFNWYSTSAVQSILLGKGNVLLRPITIPEKVDVSIFDNAYIIDSYEKLIEYLKKSPKIKRDNVFEQYYMFGIDSYKSIAEICRESIESTYSCGIDYKKVVSKIAISVRVKYELIYKVYVPLLDFLEKKQIFRNITAAYKMVKRNTASLEEQYEIEKRIKEIIK